MQNKTQYIEKPRAYAVLYNIAQVIIPDVFFEQVKRYRCFNDSNSCKKRPVPRNKKTYGNTMALGKQMALFAATFNTNKNIGAIA